MRKWSTEDEALLKQLYLINRKSTPDIANIMGRGVGSVRAKICKLNISV